MALGHAGALADSHRRADFRGVPPPPELGERQHQPHPVHLSGDGLLLVDPVQVPIDGGRCVSRCVSRRRVHVANALALTPARPRLASPAGVRRRVSATLDGRRGHNGLSCSRRRRSAGSPASARAVRSPAALGSPARRGTRKAGRGGGRAPRRSARRVEAPEAARGHRRAIELGRGGAGRGDPSSRSQAFEPPVARRGPA